MIETPVAIVTLLVFGLGAFWIGNLVVRYHQLEEAVHSGARYGARAYYAPGDGANRRRTAGQIRTFVQTAAQPVAGVTVQIRCSSTRAALDSPASSCNGGAEPDPSNQAAGTYIQVRSSAVVASDDPIMAVGRSVNSLFSTFGLGTPFPNQVTVTDASVAIVE
jgi:hypothetical protein